MARRLVLAIDLGTSGPKVAFVDSTGRALGTARGSVERTAAFLEPMDYLTMRLTGRVRTRREFDPDPSNTATYDALAEQFVRAFKATRPIHRALSEHSGAGN